MYTKVGGVGTSNGWQAAHSSDRLIAVTHCRHLSAHLGEAVYNAFFLVRFIE